MKIIYISCDGISVWEEEIKSIEFALDPCGKPYIEATRVEGDTFVMGYNQAIKITDDNKDLKPFDREVSVEEQLELGIEDAD